jgi:hypothetical protein
VAYQQQLWHDDPNPLNPSPVNIQPPYGPMSAARLNHIEAGLGAAADVADAAVNAAALGGAPGDHVIVGATAGTLDTTPDYVDAAPVIDYSFFLGMVTGGAAWTQYPYPARARRRSLLGQSFDPILGTTGPAPTSGVLSLSAIPIELPGTLGHISYVLTVVGATLTAGQTLFGFYRRVGNTATIFAKTADQSTAVTTGQGLGTKSPATPAVSSRSRLVAPGDVIYGAYISNGTTPAIVGIQAGTTNGNMTNAGLTLPDFSAATFGTGLTDLPDTIDFTTVTTVGSQRWFGAAV